jgi:acetylornithine deacetylase/succinyl-diaminopimelate desuccinylase-like protein
MFKGKGAFALLIASAIILLTLVSVAQAEGGELEKALQFAEERKDKYVSELIDLVKIPSVSTLPEHEEDMRKAANYISERCTEAGLANVEIMETGTQPIIYADWTRAPGKPTVLIYAHYDVQPADPFELWNEEPFEPTIKDGKLFGRGTSDDKQGVLLTIQAVESILKTTGALPINVKFILEGQEEIGSPQLETFLDKHGKKFAAEFCFSADGGQISEKMPRVITSLRGLAAVEIGIKTANSDLHSGTFGGAAPNALHVLTEMVASLHDKDGRVAIPGFYDDVTLMSEEEKAKTEFPDALLKWALGNDGIKATPGEEGFGPFERTTVRPTLEVIGMWGGFQGEGVKTIVPKEAHVKIACRIVGNQEARKIQNLLRKHLESICPEYAEITFKGGSFDVAQPYSVGFDAPTSVITKAVLEKTFVNTPVLFSKMGGTIPAMNLFQEKLNAESALLGFTEADNQLHAPNEFMRLSMYHKGREAYIRLMFEVSEHHSASLKTEL